jgi:hypothetical protein
MVKRFYPWLILLHGLWGILILRGHFIHVMSVKNSLSVGLIFHSSFLLGGDAKGDVPCHCTSLVFCVRSLKSSSGLSYESSGFLLGLAFCFFLRICAPCPYIWMPTLFDFHWYNSMNQLISRVLSASGPPFEQLHAAGTRLGQADKWARRSHHSFSQQYWDGVTRRGAPCWSW